MPGSQINDFIFTNKYIIINKWLKLADKEIIIIDSGIIKSSFIDHFEDDLKNYFSQGKSKSFIPILWVCGEIQQKMFYPLYYLLKNIKNNNSWIFGEKKCIVCQANCANCCLCCGVSGYCDKFCQQKDVNHETLCLLNYS